MKALHTATPGTGRPRLPWPLPAVLVWALGFGAWRLGLWAEWPPLAAWSAGLLTSAASALACDGGWRRAISAAGFPLATMAMGAGAGTAGDGWPAWAWGLAAATLLLFYPLGAWRDAPWFPTPAGALAGLAEACASRPPRSVMDAGCGLGHGLTELRQQFPQARLHGIERSRLLRCLAAWRCRWADVRGGDIWAADWSGHDLVYVFQRPESMDRAYRKAMAELPPGGWLASLEFEVPGVAAVQRLGGAGQRPVWLYRRPSTTGASCR
jgi:hypothetical protein